MSNAVPAREIATQLTAATPNKIPPFPRVFFIANVIELFERLAFYGMYINLGVYLSTTVHFDDLEVGKLLGLFAVGRAWVPVLVGGLADRIGFRRSLIIAFSFYAVGYITLFSAPTRPLTYIAIVNMSLGGAFMKPVITGCVKRYSPPGRETTGFSIFYATVNAGSTVGKILAKIVRSATSVRSTILTSVAASLVALTIAVGWFSEPKEPANDATVSTPPESLLSTLKSYGRSLRSARLVVFLVLVSGYYLLIEQFYQTFPVYMLRVFGPTAPREYVTLINPLSITILQLTVTRISQRIAPLTGIILGIGIGSISMLCMGAFPSLAGACLSFFVFSLAEMILSPRYYTYISSFAPKGREGLYMGLALIPFGLGGLAGGILSGRLISRNLPVHGAHHGLAVWGTYAAIGAGCTVVMAIYQAIAGEQPKKISTKIS